MNIINGVKGLIILLTIIILIFGSWFYFAFYGLPWAKIQVKKEAIKYLEVKYGIEFVVDSVEYDFDKKKGESGYSVRVYPEMGDKSNDGFLVHLPVIKEPSSYSDTYMERLWSNEFEDLLSEKIKRIYISNNIEIVALIYNNPIKSFNHKHDSIPKYIDIKNNVNNNISIYINRDFYKENKDDEYQRMYEVINFLNINNHNTEYVEFIFKPDIDSYKVYYIDNINKINNINDVKKYVE